MIQWLPPVEHSLRMQHKKWPCFVKVWQVEAAGGRCLTNGRGRESDTHTHATTRLSSQTRKHIHSRTTHRTWLSKILLAVVVDGRYLDDRYCHD